MRAVRYWPLAAIAAVCLTEQAHERLILSLDRAAARAWAWTYRGLWHPLSTEDWTGGAAAPLAGRLQSLVTHGFMHAGWLHLAANLAMLAVVGAAAVRRSGPGRVLALYLAALPLAGLAYALARGPGATMVGASGAIHALAGAVIAWAWIDGAGRPWRAAAPLAWAAGVAAVNLWFGWMASGRVAWELHAAGLALGALAAPIVPRRT